MNIFHFSANTRKRSKNSQFDKLGDNEEWVDFGSCSTIKWILLARSSILLLGYTYIIYIFFSQIIFEVKVNVNFYFHIYFNYKTFLKYHNEVWKWKIMLLLLCQYPKNRNWCINMTFFSFANFCVLYLHIIPFRKN